MGTENEERVLVLPPTAADAALSRRVLMEAGLACHICTDLSGLCQAFTAGAGGILLTEEVLAAGDWDCLVEALGRQPAWSDIPVLLLCASGADTPLAVRATEMLGNVTVMERPVRLTTLVSALRAALKSRRRQYELRDQIAAVREREAKLRAILTTAFTAIITIDDHGLIESVNPAAERLFGYATSEMQGRNVNMLIPSPYREEHDGYLARYLRTREKRMIGSSREVEARRKDGSVFPVELAVSEVEPLKRFTGIILDISHRKQLERDVVEIASSEQRRIGQDLHDSIAQELTALNLLVGDLARTLEADPANASKLVQRLEQGLKRSQQELRAVLRGLLPVAVDSEGLMAALTELANRTQQERQVTCTFDCSEPVAVADNLTATHLYLIAQEAVHNAVTHAKPRNIRISLHANHHLVQQVADDGVAMPARPEANRGMGLRIMRNRAAIIGAQLTIEPAEPTGTVVTCRLVRKNHV